MILIKWIDWWINITHQNWHRKEYVIAKFGKFKYYYYRIIISSRKCATQKESASPYGLAGKFNKKCRVTIFNHNMLYIIK